MDYTVYLVNVARKVNQIQLPIAFGVLVNILKVNKINHQLIDLIPVDYEEREKYFKRIISDEPAIYGFSLVVGNQHLNIAEQFAKIALKVNPDNIIVYGGPLPSSVPELLLQNCMCRYIIAGEGEVTFPALIRSICEGNFYQEDIPGVYYKKKDSTIFGSKPKWIRKLDHLSNPDFSLFDMEFYINYLRETGQSFEIMASRGCRGDCSFCYKFCGKGISIRSVDSILDDITEIIYKYDLRKFYFVDENFLEVRKYFLEFIEKKQKRGLDFTFIGQARMDTIDEEICRLGSENGLVCISSGIESISQETLDKVNKKLTVNEIVYKLKLMEKYNIRSSVSFIIGFPWDTEEDYKALIDFVQKNKLEKRFKVHYLTPLPTTRIFQYAVGKGLITDEFEYIKNLGNLYWERMINLTSMSDDVLDYYYQKLYLLGQKNVVYPKSNKYLMQINKIY